MISFDIKNQNGVQWVDLEHEPSLIQQLKTSFEILLPTNIY